MNYFKSCVTATLLLAVVLTSCKKKDSPAEEPATPTSTTGTTGSNPETGALKIQFNAVVDSLPLVFGQNFTTSVGDTFKISTFNYYISNIQLTKTDNSIYTQPESYFLVEHGNASTTLLSLNGVPAGSYKSITFMLGVDSLRNCSGAQTGALDPGKGMFWTWNTGYIMAKIEGSSPKSTASGNYLTYHIGGFKGQNKVQKNLTLTFGTSVATVAASSTPTLVLNTNVREIFRNPVTIDFAATNNVMSPGVTAKLIADNYYDMFTFKQVQ